MIAPASLCRFHVNINVNQGMSVLVMHVMASEIPTIDSSDLPAIMKDIIMTKNGLVVIVGGTRAGKSTSMAAMLDHRNEHSFGHIITVEDPIEYVHPHKTASLCNVKLVSIRKVGKKPKIIPYDKPLMLLSWARFVIKQIMELGVEFAQTGHLASATLHANKAKQTIDRILDFSPTDKQIKLMQDLSLNLRAIISQRLIKTLDGGHVAAIEILINTLLISDLISK